MPVAARLPATAIAKLTGAPNTSVTGASRAPSAMSDALLIRLAPSGALSRWVIRPKSPAHIRVARARNHSSSAWSLALSASARVAACGHRPCPSHSAAAAMPAQTARSRRSARRGS